jgi:hypothetical protein
MPTTILTFWACAIGTVCPPPANAEKWPITGSLVHCEEIQAYTDLIGGALEDLLAQGKAPRHLCTLQGEDL